MPDRKPKKLSPIRRLFLDKDMGASRVRHYTGLLAQLYRLLLAEMEVNDERTFFRQIDKYFQRLRKLGLAKPADRGNIIKALAAPEMTWKVLCKALPIHEVEEATVILKVKTKDGTIYQVESEPIAFDPVRDAITPDDVENADEPKYLTIPTSKPKPPKKP